MWGPFRNKENRRDLPVIAVAIDIGLNIVVGLLVFIGGGILLDRWLGTLPIFTLVGIALGFIVVGALFWRLATMSVPKKDLTPRENHDGIHRSSDPEE